MLSSFFSENIKERKAIQKNSLEIVRHLSHDLGERTIRRHENLEAARTFIKNYFSEFGHEPSEQTYAIKGTEVANIITEIRGFSRPDEIIVVGAHYDTVEDTPGADDNATAVAALLELYRLSSGHEFKKTVRFVAFTLEEPPFFSTEDMGSMRYACGCKKKNENIELMICLEMMGYGSKKHKQDFPMYEMKDKYPSGGDYLGVFSLPSLSEYVYLWKKIYNTHAKKKIFEIIAPASIRGMDLSDHSSFIRQGYPAIMLSDTGYYRNKNYHCPEDTYDTINYTFLTENIMDSFITLREILNMDGIKNNC
ncbi:MAG: M28 family peptidase [Spirochaetes bacterium]|jgi:Zn-dependent M28 family amino/carboxypeptidase|nr:M28 family peptidase [Spirochaetota bacterium]